MNSEIISYIVLFISIVGLGGIIYRKIPVLVNLPVISGSLENETFVVKLKKKIKKINFLKNFSSEIFLQKILSKIRILALKVEHKTSNLLQELREKNREKKENENYWENIKKLTKE